MPAAMSGFDWQFRVWPLLPVVWRGVGERIWSLPLLCSLSLSRSRCRSLSAAHTLPLARSLLSPVHTHTHRPSCWWCCLNRLIGNYGRGTGAVFFSLPQWAGLFHLCGLLAFQLSWGGASAASIQMKGAQHLEKKGFVGRDYTFVKIYVVLLLRTSIQGF